MKHASSFLFVWLLTACGVESEEPGAVAGSAGVPSTSGSSGTAPGGAGGATLATGGTSGAGQVSGAGSGGAMVGQAGSGGTLATAGASGASATAGAGGGGGSAGGNGGSGGNATSTFACSQLTGPNVAGEWFAAGFEDAVGNAAWQVKAPHHSFVEDWANPNHDVWRDSDCQGTYINCETKSRCDNATPDRVLFVTQQGDYLGTPQATWQSLIQSALVTFKAKYPGLKRVELLTFVRAPSGQDCGGETTISPLLDAAQKAVADASGGFVTVGPHLTASACSTFSGSPHMTAQGNMEIAQQLAQHYN
jgi:hypothetical protein